MTHVSWQHRSESTLAQVMADYLNQCRLAINEIFWHSFQSNIYLNICQSPSCVWIFTYLKSQQSATFPRGQWVTTLTPRQNGRNFVDDIFKSIFLSENIWIWIKISLKFVPKVPINKIPSLFQKMAWHRPGDKPLSEPMMDWWPRSPTGFLPASGSRPFRRILPIISLTNLLEANRIAGFYQFLAKTSGYRCIYVSLSLNELTLTQWIACCLCDDARIQAIIAWLAMGH